MKRISVVLTILSLLCCLSVQAQKTYSFRGKLGGNIMFRLDLEQNKDGIIAGETTYYRKNGKIAKLKVYGEYNTAANSGYNVPMLWLTEYDGTKHCGYFSVRLVNGKVNGGTWSFLSKELNINSIEQTVYPAGTKYLHPAQGNAINGVYSFTYSRGNGLDDCGGTCTLKYRNGKVYYNIGTVTPNIAEVENTATLKGSYFSGSHGKVHYKVYIDRNFVHVSSNQNGEVDDWGAHATIDGIFVKKK